LTERRRASERQDVEQIVETLEDAADGGASKVSIGDILDAFGRRGYGPLLLVPALLTASPVGAIPGMSISMAAVIALVAGQMVFGRRSPWVPASLRRISFRSKRLHETVRHGRPAARTVDRMIGSRLESLAGNAAMRAAGALCVALAVLIFPLALVPFGVLPPSVAVLLMGLAVSARDGLLMLVAMTLTVVALGVSVWLLAATGVSISF